MWGRISQGLPRSAERLASFLPATSPHAYRHPVPIPPLTRNGGGIPQPTACHPSLATRNEGRLLQPRQRGVPTKQTALPGYQIESDTHTRDRAAKIYPPHRNPSVMCC